MPKFQSKTASDALATLDRLAAVEPDSQLVDGVADLCKRASIDDDCTEYLVKFAREFVQLSGLCTEDLVKRALQRFLKGRNTDSILRGIKQASNDETMWAKSALVLLDGQKVLTAEDAALAARLDKRAAYLKALAGAGKPLAGIGKGLWGGTKALFSGGGRALAGEASRAAGNVRAVGKLGKALPYQAGRAAGYARQALGSPAMRNVGMLGLAGGAGALGGRVTAPQGHTDQDMQMAEMEAKRPYIEQSRDPNEIVDYIRQLAGYGQEASPEIWDALRFGLRYQRNSMMRYDPRQWWR